MGIEIYTFFIRNSKQIESALFRVTEVGMQFLYLFKDEWTVNSRFMNLGGRTSDWPMYYGSLIEKLQLDIKVAYDS